MQLFITKFEKKGNEIFVENKAVVDQIRKVLRGKIGDNICIQSPNLTNDTERISRYTIEITDRGRHDFTGKILKEEQQAYTNQEKKKFSKTTTLFVAMPNKRNKAELIAQKLTEIGIDKIVFWPGERSVIKWYNENKIQRVLNISREASEQSRRWSTPEIIFLDNITTLQDYLAQEKQELIVFDIPREKKHHHEITYQKDTSAILGIIGPEGGLTEKDYQYFGEFFGKDYQCFGLGDTVLRMETASILAAWELKKLTKE